MQIVQTSGMQQLENIDSNASENTAKTLSTLGFTVAKSVGADGGNAQKAVYALVYVETNGVRIGVGSPTTSLGIIIAAGESVLLESIKEVEETKFISAVGGAHATLHAQVGYSS